MDKDFVAATIQAIGRCATNIGEVRDTCLNGLVQLLSNRDGESGCFPPSASSLQLCNSRIKKQTWKTRACTEVPVSAVSQLLPAAGSLRVHQLCIPKVNRGTCERQSLGMEAARIESPRQTKHK